MIFRVKNNFPNAQSPHPMGQLHKFPHRAGFYSYITMNFKNLHFFIAVILDKSNLKLYNITTNNTLNCIFIHAEMRRLIDVYILRKERVKT